MLNELFGEKKKERKHQLCTLEINNPSTTGLWNKRFPSRESHVQVTTLGGRKTSASHKSNECLFVEVERAELRSHPVQLCAARKQALLSSNWGESVRWGDSLENRSHADDSPGWKIQNTIAMS